MAAIRSDSAQVVQTAIYSRLSSALSESVYSAPPDAESFPYVIIGLDGIGESGDASGRLLEHTIEIRAYSSARGSLAIKGLCGRILAELTRVELDLSADDYSAMLVRHLSSDFDVSVNGAKRIFDVTIRLTVTVQDTLL